MKKRAVIMLILAACAFLFTSCLVTPPSVDENSGSYVIVRAADGTNFAMPVREAYYKKSDVMANVYTDEAEEQKNEIVLGPTSRSISEYAESLFEGKSEDCGYSDPGGFVICQRDGSVAVWWSEERFGEAAVEYFISEYVEKVGFELPEGHVYIDVYSISAVRREEEQQLKEQYYESIASGLGENTAQALRELYSLYDERLYLWMASLYDPGVGGYYYSNSALASQGYLPDLESTNQALRFISASGMLNNYKGDSKALQQLLSKRVQQSFIDFTHSCQSSRDGYYYHPQWGENVSVTRSGRDTSWGVSILSIFGQKPLYDTPTGVDGTQGAPSGVFALTEHISSGGVASVSFIVNTATVADRFSTAEKFEEYFNSLDWADPNPNSAVGSSYSAGGALDAQCAQIRAAGLSELCVDLLDEKQEQVQQSLRDGGYEENGLWDPNNSYDAVNGAMKISAVYNDLGGKLNYAERIMESAIEMITLTEPDFNGKTASAGVSVFNPWVVVCNLLTNMESFGASDDAAVFKAQIRERAAQMISITKEKLSVFKLDDGSFAMYEDGSNSGILYGSRVSVPYAMEGDVNGACIVSTGTLGRMCIALGIKNYIGLNMLPLYYESDLLAYIAVLESATPVVKDDIVIENTPIDFESSALGDEDDDIPGITVKKNNGVFTIVEDDMNGGERVLRHSTTESEIGGDSVVIKFLGNSEAPCYVLEWRMKVERAGEYQSLMQIRLSSCYQLLIKHKGEKLQLYNSTDLTGRNDYFANVELEFDRWYTYRIEYYPSEDNAVIRLYIDGKLSSETDNYYGKHGGSAPSKVYTQATFFTMRRSECVVYFDDIMLDRTDGEID